MPIARMAGACASLAIRCARPASSSALAAVGVAPTEPPVDRRRGQLDPDAGVDELPQPFGTFLHLAVSLRMRQHRAEAAHADAEREVRGGPVASRHTGTRAAGGPGCRPDRSGEASRRRATRHTRGRAPRPEAGRRRCRSRSPSPEGARRPAPSAPASWGSRAARAASPRFARCRRPRPRAGCRDMPSIVCGPSSSAGRTWEWRSITRSSRACGGRVARRLACRIGEPDRREEPLCDGRRLQSGVRE